MRLAEEKPDLIRSMIIHEPPLFALLSNHSMAPLLNDIKERISAVATLLETGYMEEGARQFIETIALGPGAWEQLPPELREKIIFNAPTFLDELHDEECFSIELPPLKDFFQPVLLTSGKESPSFFLTIMEKLAATFPQVELKSIAGAGHGPEQTHPEEYISTIKEFIRKV
jgi:pimeloyl-ACP methyl ester carboxylesterase